MEITVKGLDKLEHGGCIPFAFTRKDGNEAQGFIIKVQKEYKAYLNRCNHWPVELDLGDGEFYYSKIDRITCKSHGATYQLDTGFCDGGPCAGSHLKKFELKVMGGEGFVDTGDY